MAKPLITVFIVPKDGAEVPSKEDLPWTEDLPTSAFTIEIAKEKDSAKAIATYLADHYDSLPEYLLILPSDPFPFMTMPKEKFLETLAKDPSVLYDKTQWTQVLRANGQGYPHHPGLPIAETFIKLFPGYKPPAVFEFVAGAQFMTTKARIQQNPRDFYVKLQKLVESDKSVCKYTMERLWPSVLLVQPHVQAQAATQGNTITM